MRDLLKRIALFLRSLLPVRYYIVEFNIDGRHSLPAMDNIKPYRGCVYTGVFTSWHDAFAYWEYRTLDTKDPGFTYTITKLPKDDELVQLYIEHQQGK